MSGLGQLGAFVALLGLVVAALTLFAGIGALIAHLRELPPTFGAMYGAVLGPIGMLAVLILPRRLLGDSTATHSRLTSWVPEMRASVDTFTQEIDDPYV
jgi:hypothetical protein